MLLSKSEHTILGSVAEIKKIHVGHVEFEKHISYPRAMSEGNGIYESSVQQQGQG